MNLVARLLAVGITACTVISCGGSGSGGGQQPLVRLFNGMVGQASIYAQFQDVNLVALGTSPNASFAGFTADTSITPTTASAVIWGSTGQLFSTPASLFQSSTDYTLYTYGYALYGSHSLTLTDSQAVSTGATIAVRAVQLGFNNRTVDVYVLPSVSPLTPTNVLFSSLSTGAVSSGANIDANGYEVISLAGGASEQASVTGPGSQTLLNTATFTPTQGHYYTVVIFDSAIGSGSQTSVAVLDDRRP
jgi:hypothetical protein